MKKRPNIILIQTDQQYAGTLACYGNAVSRNPAIEAIAAKGSVFERAYCNYPACVPSRASMMSGRYPHSIRSHANFQHLNPQEVSLPQVLRDNGYHTALIGKNHCFTDGKNEKNQYPDAPEGRCEHPVYDQLHRVFHTVLEAGHVRIEGYEDDPEVAASCRWARENCWGIQHSYGENPYPKEKCITQLLGDRAVAYITEQAAQDAPFFLWLSFPDPHTPYQAPQPYAGMYRPEEMPPPIADVLENKPERQRVARRMDLNDQYDVQHFRTLRAIHYGMIRFIDDNIARVLACLEQVGLADDTILSFTSDHGDAMGDHGILQKQNFFYDGFTHVPLIFCWGDRFGGRRCSSPAELVDIMPTLLELADVPVPFGVQGKSFAPWLLESAPPPRQYAVIESGEPGEPFTWDEAMSGGDALLEQSKFAWCAFREAWFGLGKCIFDGRWKLAIYTNGEGELYDLMADPQELRNCYGLSEYRDVETELKYRLLLWCMESEDPIPLNTTMKLHARKAIKKEGP